MSLKSSITKIVQNSNVTWTLAVATATAARYSSDPAASNITSVGAKATASSVVVNPVYEITNASSDAQGFGFSNSTLGFKLEWKYTQKIPKKTIASDAKNNKNPI